VTALAPSAPLRGTQSLVGFMGWAFRRPSLTVLEVAWRWLFGIPLLLVCWRQAQQIVAAFPVESSGFNSIDPQNPWVAIVQLANVVAYYRSPVLAVLRWLVPSAAIVWVVISGVGRNLVLKRIDPRLRFRPTPMIALQAAWLALLALTCWLWFRSMQWVAVTHITATGDPDLVGYAAWAITLSLAFYTLWALTSWALSIAPLLMLLEDRSAISALGQSLRLGKPFTSKLAETNLVMGIVKLMLIVLAMVFSAAPLPFSDELGSDALHFAVLTSTILYFVASDFFHIARLKGFIEFWRTFRGSSAL
jgi:hypothetical protein